MAESESLKRAHPKFQGRPQHIRDPVPWTAAGVLWKQFEPTRQATCALESRAKEVELSMSPGVQMSNFECSTLLGFGFALM